MLHCDLTSTRFACCVCACERVAKHTICLVRVLVCERKKERTREGMNEEGRRERQVREREGKRERARANTNGTERKSKRFQSGKRNNKTHEPVSMRAHSVVQCVPQRCVYVCVRETERAEERTRHRERDRESARECVCVIVRQSKRVATDIYMPGILHTNSTHVGNYTNTRTPRM